MEVLLLYFLLYIHDYMKPMPIFIVKAKIPWHRLFAKLFLSVRVLFARAIYHNYPNDRHGYHTYI